MQSSSRASSLSANLLLDQFLSPTESVWLALNSAAVSIVKWRYEDATERLQELLERPLIVEALQTHHAQVQDEIFWMPQDRQDIDDDDDAKLVKISPMHGSFPFQRDLSFLCPFVMDQPYKHNSADQDDLKLALSMCVVALFNMAVAHHCQAFANNNNNNNHHGYTLTSKVSMLRSPVPKTTTMATTTTNSTTKMTTSREHLQCARALYTQADALLMGITAGDELDAASTMFYLYLAICNNMVEVEATLGNCSRGWQAVLAESFCLVPKRPACRTYQHFCHVVETYEGLMTITK